MTNSNSNATTTNTARIDALDLDNWCYDGLDNVDGDLLATLFCRYTNCSQARFAGSSMYFGGDYRGIYNHSVLVSSDEFMAFLDWVEAL